jgi:hypothetical protein
MDSEKKLPKSSMLPARKAKVFQNEPQTPSESPIWVPPSFASRDQRGSSEHGRVFKSKKPSFIPKVSQSLETPSEETPVVESRPPVEDFQSAPAAQDRSPKVSPVWVGTILAGALICFFLVGWLAYHQGFSASQKRLNELRMELPPAIPPEFQASIDSALKAYSKGDAADAVEILSGVYRKNQTIPSTCYLMALTAIQSGNLQIASEKVDETKVEWEIPRSARKVFFDPQWRLMFQIPGPTSNSHPCFVFKAETTKPANCLKPPACVSILLKAKPWSIPRFPF